MCDLTKEFFQSDASGEGASTADATPYEEASVDDQAYADYADANDL